MLGFTKYRYKVENSTEKYNKKTKQNTAAHMEVPYQTPDNVHPSLLSPLKYFDSELVRVLV